MTRVMSNPYFSDIDDFPTTLEKFEKFHRNEGNILGHFVTSSLGLLGFFGLLNTISRSKKPTMVGSAVYLYFLYYDYSLPRDLFAQTAVIICCLVFLSFKINPCLPTFGTMLVLGYALQDLAHIFAAEQTFQENTWGKSETAWSSAVSMFFQHVFYLTPLVSAVQTQEVQNFTYILPLLLLCYGNYQIDSSSYGFPHAFISVSEARLRLSAAIFVSLSLKKKKKTPPFIRSSPVATSRKVRALFGKMNLEEEVSDLSEIRRWAIEQNPPNKKTSHWWVAQLGKSANEAFHRVENCQSVKRMFAEKFDPDVYNLDVVGGMNELYIAGPNRAGSSDQVFFTEHIDGPYILFPFASVYRCIVGTDGNTEIATIYPNIQKQKVAQLGDILAFDFNREPHLISADGNNPNKDFRVVLKLHYVVYPKNLAIFGHMIHWLTTRYNELFRSLFLFTLTPTKGSISSFVGTYGVNWGTVAYNSVDKFLGTSNLLYVAAAAAAAKTLGSRSVFMVLTHYVHYFRYISTYYIRKNVNYGIFKRDVLFFKSVALLQIAHMVFSDLFSSSSVNFLGLAIIIVGYSISMAATAALGVDGTYFGIELGFVKANYQFVKSFPYNVIPHPMILGQVS